MQVRGKISNEASGLHSPTRKKIVALAGLTVVCALPIVLFLYLRAEVLQQPLSIGQAVPRVELVSLLDRSSIILGSATDTKQAVLFFTVECPHCRNQMFNFEILYRRYQRRVEFIAVSLSDSVKTQNVLREKAFSFPVALDEHRKAKEEYRIVSVPALFLIDGKGILRYRRFGAVSITADDKLFQTFLHEPASVSAR